jgi:membrane protein DedA with SNARE-associated domain
VPDWIVDLFARYGYWVVFIGVFLENAGLPVPGETALLAGAALANFGRLSLPWVILTAVAGAILGDNLGFFVGRHGGRALAERYGRRVGFTRKRFAQFDRFFERHGGRTVFLARFITGLRVVGAVLAGGSGLRWPIFLVYNAAGAVAWATTFGILGYALGESWDVLERWIGRSSILIVAAVGVLVVVWIARARRASTS